MKENTCGNCKNVEAHKLGNMMTFGCALDGYVIPHEAESKTQTVKFWRIPTSCQRDDVVKSDKQASKSEWVIKSFRDFD